MNNKKIGILQKLDFLLFGWIINWIYPKYYRPKYGYQSYLYLILNYAFPQKILGINRSVKWPVHFTSKIINSERISKGILCDPGDSINNYIQGTNGIIFGNNIEIGPGVSIISANHNPSNFQEHFICESIIIGNHVWIGANVTILPGVKIGSNVIIGANSLINKNVPDNVIVAGNPFKIIKEKSAYQKDIYSVKLNRKSIK
ncbi:MAG: acyltransferase [Lutibacter sp.]